MAQILITWLDSLAIREQGVQGCRLGMVQGMKAAYPFPGGSVLGCGGPGINRRSFNERTTLEEGCHANRVSKAGAT